MRTPLEKELLTLIGVALGSQWALSLLSPNSLLTFERTILAGIGLVWIARDKTLLLRRPSSFPKSLLALLVLLFIAFLPLGIAASFGWISFTYGNLGLDASFKKELPFRALYFFLTALIGTEIVFRAKFFAAFENSLGGFGTNLTQALLYATWLVLGLWPFLVEGEVPSSYFFVIAEFLRALIAGSLYSIFRSVWVSGIWSFITGFLGLILLSPIGSGLETGYYLVTSNSSYSLTTLFLLLVGSAALSGYTLRRNM